MRAKRMLSAAGLAIGLAVTGLAAPAPAAASIPGLVRVAFTVPAADPAIATVPCPAGKVVYGLGGEVH